jgi:hypothetical protein
LIEYGKVKNSNLVFQLEHVKPMLTSHRLRYVFSSRVGILGLRVHGHTIAGVVLIMLLEHLIF